MAGEETTSGSKPAAATTIRLVNFISDDQLDEAKRTRGERADDGTAQRDKPLFQILQENKEKKEAEFNERLKHIKIGRVRFPQATGSRSYVAQLHSYKQKNKNVLIGEVHDGELDAVDVFKDCHTSRKKGLSDAARDAICTMETLRAEPGHAPIASAEIVSKVLFQKSTKSTFLKNVGIPMKYTSVSQL